MKLTKEVLTKTIIEVLKEATSSGGGGGGSAEDALAALNQAKQDADAHRQAEPAKQKSKETPWTRYSADQDTVYKPTAVDLHKVPKAANVSTDITSFRQTLANLSTPEADSTRTTFDKIYGTSAKKATPKYYAPSPKGSKTAYYDATKELGGSYKPRPKGGKTYGNEAGDYASWKTSTSYKGKDTPTAWGNWRQARGAQDSDSFTFSDTKSVESKPFQYAALGGKPGGEITPETGVDVTTEPNEPEYGSWATKMGDYDQAVRDAEDALKKAGEEGEEGRAQAAGGQTGGAVGGRGGKGRGRGGKGRGRSRKGRGRRGAKSGWGKGKGTKSGWGKGKSAGKGKGKGKGKKGKGKKKKDESLFRILGRDLINEFKEIKKYSK